MTDRNDVKAGAQGNNNEPFRSVNCHRRSFIRFVNKTQRRVDVIWINYEGVRVKYKTLASEEFLDVDTFVSHPWIFRDSETRDMLVARTSLVFRPESWQNMLVLAAPAGQAAPRLQRLLVHITLPVYSLRERSLQVVRGLLSRHEDAYRLNIPSSLQQELASKTHDSVPSV